MGDHDRAHGLFGFREEFGTEYFNGIAERLRSRFPVNVVATQVDGSRSVAYRAGQLHRQFLVAWGEVPPHTKEEHEIPGSIDPALPTHVIAHSMGALDCRQLLSPANPDSLGDRVVSLTTVAGIHRGSPSADLAWNKLHGNRLNPLERLFAWLIMRGLAVAGVSLAGIHDLTTASTARFNEVYVDHPGVRYRSVAGRGRDGRRKAGLPLLWSWRHIKRVTGEENDGAVMPSSARWGEFDPDLWPADHAEEIGHDLNDFGKAPKEFDYLARWTRLVATILEVPTP